MKNNFHHSINNAPLQCSVSNLHFEIYKTGLLFLPGFFYKYIAIQPKWSLRSQSLYKWVIHHLPRVRLKTKPWRMKILLVNKQFSIVGDVFWIVCCVCKHNIYPILSYIRQNLIDYVFQYRCIGLKGRIFYVFMSQKLKNNLIIVGKVKNSQM